MVSQIVIILDLVGAFLGIFGSLSFILSFILLKEIRTQSRIFILTLSIYNFLIGVFALLPGYKNQTICKIQCFLLDSTFPAACFWIFQISFAYYLQICRGFDMENSKLFFWISFVTIQLICFFLGALSLSIGTIFHGRSYWCFLSNRKLHSIHYALIWVFLAATPIFYTLVICKIRKKETNYPKSFQIKMFFLAFVYVFTEFWLTINRATQDQEENKHEESFLDSAQAFFSPLLGFWDFVFFVWGDNFVWALIVSQCCGHKYTPFK
ncbi:g protein-coupled receptor [Anaeramoeba ignava]|uniref:G protein-coupled receptor n=1 Tax=Anaeramoeba ignava TaxID=1746090 RepID=A0A9Q0LCN1_ANAIG|nr:g protein-coupled receptor [Anaeramoeba ignava]